MNELGCIYMALEGHKYSFSSLRHGHHGELSLLFFFFGVKSKLARSVIRRNTAFYLGLGLGRTLPLSIR